MTAAKVGLVIVGGALVATGTLFGFVYLALCEFVQMVELD